MQLISGHQYDRPATYFSRDSRDDGTVSQNGSQNTSNYRREVGYVLSNIYDGQNSNLAAVDNYNTQQIDQSKCPQPFLSRPSSYAAPESPYHYSPQARFEVGTKTQQHQARELILQGQQVQHSKGARNISKLSEQPNTNNQQRLDRVYDHTVQTADLKSNNKSVSGQANGVTELLPRIGKIADENIPLLALYYKGKDINEVRLQRIYAQAKMLKERQYNIFKPNDSIDQITLAPGNPEICPLGSCVFRAQNLGKGLEEELKIYKQLDHLSFEMLQNDFKVFHLVKQYQPWSAASKCMEDVCNRAVIQRKLSSLPETSTLDLKSQVIWEASEAFENQRKAAKLFIEELADRKQVQPSNGSKYNQFAEKAKDNLSRELQLVYTQENSGELNTKSSSSLREPDYVQSIHLKHSLKAEKKSEFLKTLDIFEEDSEEIPLNYANCRRTSQKV